MSGKYDALIAEAEKRASILTAKPASENSDPHSAELFELLATALREAQAHVPPEGWRVTEYSHANGVVQQDNTGKWWVQPEDETKWPEAELQQFPTAAAAMTAIEEIGK